MKIKHIDFNRNISKRTFKQAGYKTEYDFLDSLNEKQYTSLMKNYKSNNTFANYQYLWFVLGFGLSVIIYILDK